MESNLKVILLGDKSVAKDVLPPDCLVNQFTIDLYCGSLIGYVEMDETELHRVYLESPASLACLWASPGPLAQSISELFKIAAVLTNTKGIKPYFGNSASAVYKILCLYQEEMEGVELITPSNLDPIVEAWLFRKGFQNREDICRLQNALRSIRDLWRELNQGNDFAEDALDDIPTPVDDALEINELDDLIEESLGSSDEIKEQEMFQLVEVRKQHMLAGCSSLEEVEILNSEMNDIPNSSCLKDLVPISDHRDLEDRCLATSSTMANSLCLPLNHLLRKRTKRERDTAILDGVSYRGYWKPSIKSGNLVIHVAPDIAAILLSFPGQSRAEFPEEIQIKAEICPDKRHPCCWAKEAQDNDPSVRLAFHVSMGQRTVYPSICGSVPIRKANTFVDWVTGVPVEMIATRPRRHINAHEEGIVKALGCPRKGTYYTDAQGNIV
ncbi:hypothetical protein BDV38DRAFT_283522 [Aspergillus pseudotamarii]|uniref:Uncharacterized protein n=1 Tax=Aspergillus pseudotamarii TaxID=132259 RepID=A0A5N6SSJ4_ASPPS|nr:uncharacterized protein BDV38DRAFT_283522 [Aspergillus pseudotamarii]KAE8136847.1 hypothetical protein BDV38DRAFT_283522 [Aspergillus pseudotamarii]